MEEETGRDRALVWDFWAPLDLQVQLESLTNPSGNAAVPALSFLFLKGQGESRDGSAIWPVVPKLALHQLRRLRIQAHLKS